jgi:hypothetical protein
MSIKTSVHTPENTLNYMKYVEIENDTRYPAVTGGNGIGVFNKSAVLVHQVDPFNIGAGNGSTGQDYIEKFGANLNVNGNLETVWEPGGIYEYLSTASTVTAISDSSADSSAGTGARTVELLGLDTDYNIISDIITTNGTSAGTASTKEFLRIYRAQVQHAGSTGTNAGNILIKANGLTVISIGTHGTGSNTEGFGQSQTSVYTIPAGKTGYITQWTVGSSIYNAGVHAYLQVADRTNGSTSRTKDIMFLNNYAVKDYKIPLRVLEKSDIEVRAYDASSGAAVSTSYNVILIDN